MNILIPLYPNSPSRMGRSIDVVFLFLFITFLVPPKISCQNAGSDNVLVNINIEKNIKKFKPQKISDLKGEIIYIPIKNDSIPLGGIYHIDFTKDFILLSDNINCLAIDYNGVTLAKIGRSGKGPGEYQSILNIEIGPAHSVYLQSWGNILEYGLNGKFIRMFTPEVSKVTGSMKYWAVFNDSTFIGQIPNYSGREKNKAVFFAGDGRTINFIKNFVFLNKKSSSSEDARTSIYSFNGKTYFKEMMNDTIFLATPQYLFKPVYNLDLGKFKVPKEVRELSLIESTKDISAYIKVRFVYETNQYLFLDCDFGKNSPVKRPTPVFLKEYGVTSSFYTVNMLGMFNKASHELVFASPEKTDNALTNTGLFNDFDGGPNFYPKVSVNDSTMAMWVDAYQIKEHVASDAFKKSTPKYPEKMKELQKLADSLSENDNPVLILCTFKK